MAYIGGIVAEDCAGLQVSFATRALRAFTRVIGRMPTRVHFPGQLRKHTGPQFGPVRGGVLEGTPSDTSHRGNREHRTPPPSQSGVRSSLVNYKCSESREHTIVDRLLRVGVQVQKL